MDMVEKVARRMIPHPSDYAEFIDRAQEDPEGTFLDLAKLAIEAMREPTDAMLEAAGAMENYDMEAEGGRPDDDHKQWWASMIDAALGRLSDKAAEDRAGAKT